MIQGSVFSYRRFVTVVAVWPSIKFSYKFFCNCSVFRRCDFISPLELVQTMPLKIELAVITSPSGGMDSALFHTNRSQRGHRSSLMRATLPTCKFVCCLTSAAPTARLTFVALKVVIWFQYVTLAAFPDFVFRDDFKPLELDHMMSHSSVVIGPKSGSSSSSSCDGSYSSVAKP